MAQNSYLYEVLSEIIRDSRKYLDSSVKEHVSEFFGSEGAGTPVSRMSRHLQRHVKRALEAGVAAIDLDRSGGKGQMLDELSENINVVLPQLNRLWFSLSGSNEIDGIPIIDNHSHAGDFEQRFNCPEGITLKILMDIVELTTAISLLSPEEGKQLWEMYTSNQREELEELLSVKGILGRCKSSVEHFRSTAMWSMLVQGFKELYPGVLSEQDIAGRVEKQRQLGLASSYMRIFDRAKIAVAFCQRDNLDPVWDTQRFRFVLRIDPFIEAKLHEPLFKIALDAQGLEEPPTEFDDYVLFLDHVVNHFKARGTVAAKIHCAYVRPILFRDPPLTEARRSFAATSALNKAAIELDQYCQPLESREQQYPFQDYLVRHMLKLCGELDLPVQFHTGWGFLPGLELRGSSPLNLENIITDPVLRKIKVVLLHGGYPFFDEAVSLARMWSNVYLDISGLTFLFNHSLSSWLTECIEFLPEDKLLFGTDAIFPELYYAAAQNGRRQLSTAIENLIRNNSLSVSRATRIAERVLYRNAQLLYSLSSIQSR